MTDNVTDCVIVLCTCANEAESERIAAALVGERLAACVNIFPPIRSIYRWKDVVEDARESLLFIKSTTGRWPALRDRIAALHSYETPEIIAVPIIAGSEKYLNWLREQL
jgi:periplasmic divalent cation tolerance protein